ncbi:MAG: hypoxanthine phosphoribosyltransferase [Deltaproteobacteria bacterium CG11_big_fil_rev_8_21_14_0_20_42_23]|nr:MAG: hypoxanthine phosphoribosyltransferase [Deltaproteobacteria bacterium CG11_big_fil_rev_8_21_14_0_20_42_23]PJC63821.1 MAG: hypoxanthine phosphoribosyltransferase [Deltaproteobacteria bacterium CG_4_9_14_0_2_um_filter_42_21]
MLSVQDRDIEVIYSAEEIQDRIKQLVEDIRKEYGAQELVVIGVLKGSFIFMADLVRHLKLPVSCDFLRVASYEGDKSTGHVRMDFDMTQPIDGKHVLLVEDIVDTGTTLRYLLQHLHAKNPASLKVATLLYKETGSGMKDYVDYVAFNCPDRYVIGYGLDSEGLFRDLPFVGAFTDF